MSTLESIEFQAIRVSALTDADLVAEASGLSRETAEMLCTHFGGFAEAAAAPPHILQQLGVSPARIVRLKLIESAAQRLLRTRIMRKPALSSWSALIDYCTAAMARDATEQFRVLFLDRKNVLIADEVMNRGTVDHTPVYPREIVKRALLLDASAVILTHNHPSGDPTPSQADIAMTRLIVDGFKPFGIAVHDHLVIGRHGHASFKALGLL